jgi:hypothetical protein
VSATQEGERCRYVKRRTETGARRQPMGSDSPNKGPSVYEGKLERKDLRG